MRRIVRAEGVQNLVDIATAAGTSHDTLAQWRRDPAFQERVQEVAQLIAGDQAAFVTAARTDTIRHAKEVTDGLWDVSEHSKSGQARVAALNTLARIAGLLGQGGGRGHLDVDVNTEIHVGTMPGMVDLVDVSFDTVVLRRSNGNTDDE